MSFFYEDEYLPIEKKEQDKHRSKRQERNETDGRRDRRPDGEHRVNPTKQI